MRIPGIPGASEPAFRTRDQELFGLDTMVGDACVLLSEDGVEVSPHVVKTTVQIARGLMLAGSELGGDALIGEVRLLLQDCRVILSVGHVWAVLKAYGRVVVSHDIADVVETQG
jgi:carbonic anhydrase/acetyltransferase-like protein (isoleucine patch superfamily)